MHTCTALKITNTNAVSLLNAILARLEFCLRTKIKKKKIKHAMTPKEITCYMQAYTTSVPAGLHVIEADAIHKVLHIPCCCVFVN